MSKFIAKNIQIVKDKVIATGEDFLNVTADIFDGETLVEQKKYGFSFDITPEEIKTAIAKSLSTMRIELEQAEKNKEQNALEEKADEAIENISGLEIEEPDK